MVTPFPVATPVDFEEALQVLDGCILLGEQFSEHKAIIVRMCRKAARDNQEVVPLTQRELDRLHQLVREIRWLVAAAEQDHPLWKLLLISNAISYNINGNRTEEQEE